MQKSNRGITWDYTGETKIVSIPCKITGGLAKIRLRQIHCIKSFENKNVIVKTGEMGGWIQIDANLRYNAWLDSDSMVYGCAFIAKNTSIINTTVDNSAAVHESEIWDSKITGNASVINTAGGNCEIGGNDKWIQYKFLPDKTMQSKKPVELTIYKNGVRQLNDNTPAPEIIGCEGLIERQEAEIRELKAENARIKETMDRRTEISNRISRLHDTNRIDRNAEIVANNKKFEAELSAKDEEIANIREGAKMHIKMTEINCEQAIQKLKEDIFRGVRFELDIAKEIRDELRETKRLTGEHDPDDVIGFKGSLVRIFAALKANGIIGQY